MNYQLMLHLQPVIVAAVVATFAWVATWYITENNDRAEKVARIVYFVSVFVLGVVFWGHIYFYGISATLADKARIAEIQGGYAYLDPDGSGEYEYSYVNPPCESVVVERVEFVGHHRLTDTVLYVSGRSPTIFYNQIIPLVEGAVVTVFTDGRPYVLDSCPEVTAIP